MHSYSNPVRPQATTEASRPSGRIDRKALVQRHNVRQQTLDPRSPVSVGNGEFAFTMDLTGLQTLPGDYPVGPREDALPPGTLLGTQSTWGWHSTPAGEHYNPGGLHSPLRFATRTRAVRGHGGRHRQRP
ncbi:hypothetical protein QF031_002847 [Pseudarthrobacter defluvii]|nr:hypothetical protein [Pseudarthrobacter defluvii]